METAEAAAAEAIAGILPDASTDVQQPLICILG